MLITQFDKFVNRSTQQILGSQIERENLVPMLSSDIPVPDIPVKLQNIQITENGIYYPETGFNGFYEVNVNVSGDVPQSYINYAKYRLNYPVCEYQVNIYGNAPFIDAMGAVLIGDFANGGISTGNILTGSLSNFTGFILQGIYKKQPLSNYNTSMLHWDIVLNTEYWAGMRDRNTEYDCFVTFTDNTHCNLRGTKQILIYGLP